MDISWILNSKENNGIN